MASSDSPDKTRRPRKDTALLTQRLTFMINRVASLMNGFGQPEFRQMGLSIPEARALISLEELGSLKVGELASLVSMDFSAMSYLLGRLERTSLIERLRDPNDARGVCIALTDGGAELARKCRDASVSHEKTLIAGLRKSDVQALKNLLNTVTANAARQPGQPPVRKAKKPANGPPKEQRLKANSKR